MLGAIAEGDTVVHGFLNSADCLATIDCFRRMGVKIEELRGEAGENGFYPESWQDSPSAPT